MKIGIFTDSYKPYTSGVVRSIETFNKEFQELGHETYIFAPSYPHYQKESKVFRFISVPAPTNPDFSLALPFSLRLRQNIKNLHLDLIHVHSPFLLGRLGAKYARLLNVPLVFTFHTMYEQYVHYVPIGQNITKEITRVFCREFCNSCDLVITPTGIVARHLKDIGVYKEVRSIPTGIDLREFNNQDRGWLRKEYNIAQEDKILLCVGRLGQEKNHNFVLEAFKRVSERVENTKLVLVGGGPEEKALKGAAARLGLENKVVFTGTLPREKVILCFCGADIFVFASLTETQGLVIGEAQAAGLPSVAIKANGVSEMISDGVDGFLTENELNQFVERILFLITNEQLYSSMSKNALESAGIISSRNCALKLLAGYESLLSGREVLAQ